MDGRGAEEVSSVAIERLPAADCCPAGPPGDAPFAFPFDLPCFTGADEVAPRLRDDVAPAGALVLVLVLVFVLVVVGRGVRLGVGLGRVGRGEVPEAAETGGENEGARALSPDTISMEALGGGQ